MQLISFEFNYFQIGTIEVKLILCHSIFSEILLSYMNSTVD